MDLETITGPSGARFRVHKQYAPNFMGLLSDLNARGYAVDGKQSGGYNYRTIDGTKTLSNHAYGKAIDVNWTDNARGKRGTIPEDVAKELAVKHGLTWGGGWKNRDDMHFEVANTGSIPMAQRGLTSFAGMTPTGPNPNVLGPNGGINVAADQTPQTSPITTGSVAPAPAQGPPMANQNQGPEMGLIERLMNPMTMAGLAILGDPRRDAARGFAAAGDMSKSMNSRFEEQRKRALAMQQENQFKSVLDGMGDQAGPMAPLISQLGPEKGVPLLIELMQKKQAESRQAEEWAVRRKHIEAQTAQTNKAIESGATMPANIQEWNAFQKMTPEQQRQFLTMKRADRYLDTGTEFLQPNPISPGQNVQVVPKNLAEAEKQKQLGEAEGKQVAAAPSDIDAADAALDLIGKIKTDKNIDIGTGFSSYGNVVRGTPGFDFQNKVNQARSKAFLTAIQQLRGMGSLSNAEGSTATDAINRMDTATSKDEFLGAVAEYETIVGLGRDRASARLQNQIPPNQRRGGYLDKMRAEDAARAPAPSLPPGWSIERVP